MTVVHVGKMAVAWTREVLAGRKRGKQLPEKGRDFPGSPVVKTSPSSVGGTGSVSGLEAEMPTCPRAKGPKHKTEAIL